MNSRMSDANTLEHHLPVHSGGKVKSEWWFLFLGSHGQTMVQTARKWGIFCPSMNYLPLWCSVLCLWHIPASCWKQAVPESRDCLEGGISCRLCSQEHREHTMAFGTPNQPGCPGHRPALCPPSPGKLHSAQTPFPRENRDTAAWQLKPPSITEKITYLVLLSRESLIWINSSNSYHHLNTGQPLLCWGLDHLFHQQNLLVLFSFACSQDFCWSSTWGFDILKQQVISK